MTNTQRQHLLAYLGYYKSTVDGEWGPISESSCADFQKAFGGIAVDGIGGPETDQALKHAVAYGLPRREEVKSEAPVNDNNVPITGTFWDDVYPIFTREEFRCRCGGKYCDGFPAEPKEELVRIAYKLRMNLGVPVSVVSGLRCQRWNAIQGGVANSQHMYGEAVDIYAKGKTQAQVESELDRIGGVRYHYPISGSSNVHFDIPKGAR